MSFTFLFCGNSRNIDIIITLMVWQNLAVNHLVLTFPLLENFLLLLYQYCLLQICINYLCLLGSVLVDHIYLGIHAFFTNFAVLKYVFKILSSEPLYFIGICCNSHSFIFDFTESSLLVRLDSTLSIRLVIWRKWKSIKEDSMMCLKVLEKKEQVKSPNSRMQETIKIREASNEYKLYMLLLKYLMLSSFNFFLVYYVCCDLLCGLRFDLFQVLLYMSEENLLSIPV